MAKAGSGAKSGRGRSGGSNAGPGKGGAGKGGPGKGGSGRSKGSGTGAASKAAVGPRALKTRVKTAKKRTVSQQRWLERQLNDPYVAEARRQGFRSRAAFKLEQIARKHRLLLPGDVVIDLGAAPGGWAQVAVARVKALDTPEAPAQPSAQDDEVASPGDDDTARRVPSSKRHGTVIGIDIAEMEPVAGATILHLDFMEDEAPARLQALLPEGGADVVLSDMAAPATGHTRTDHLRIMGLAEAAAEFAFDVLKPGGWFLAKVLQGGTERDLLNALKRNFRVVKHVKPDASRADSAELYVLATGFRGRDDVPALTTDVGNG